MPKSRIIKEIANGTVDIEISLNRLLLLARDIGDENLILWAENELKGYSSDAELPEYRKIQSNSFRYSGLAGQFQVKNVALQLNLISKKHRDIVSQIEVRTSVLAIRDIVASKKEVEARDVSWLIDEVYSTSDGHIQATSIIQLLPSSMYQDIYSGIKNKIINELIKLEQKYGNLDTLEIQSDDDPENVAFWNNINERIKRQAKELYMQNFYDAAVDRAIKEVETKLRQMFRELKPETSEPRNISDIINALLGENGAYKYCDTSTQDGKNYCKGFVELVHGFFTAYRNPLSHNNHEIDKKDAFGIITLSSIIMDVLDQDSI